MSNILVQSTAKNDGWNFNVVVKENGSQTSHKVSMSKLTYEKLTAGKVSPDLCVEKSFKFLLEREPKESILGSFDITIISKYFPEFEDTLKAEVEEATAKIYSSKYSR